MKALCPAEVVCARTLLDFCRQREDDRDKSHLMFSLSESAECVNVSELKQIGKKKHTRVILFKFHTKTTLRYKSALLTCRYII